MEPSDMTNRPNDETTFYKKGDPQSYINENIGWQKSIFRFFRRLSFLFLAIATLLVIDFYLPSIIIKETAIEGWQQREGATRSLKNYDPGKLVSYMRTKDFTIAVPHPVHLNYDYYSDEKPIVIFEFTPILKTAKAIGLSNYEMYPAPKTIYSFGIPLHYLLLVSSLFTVLRKNYSRLNYSLCFLPALLFSALILVAI
ncbi:hypothetical protein ACFQ21_29465 [Ohtaekwangia kribbensis]|jgi:hypothetical protein|uniref:Uncharacterized protein n=1 Tax=Ohtaekwangia kribbensis TaxID=688913 RepID=A0ABW3KC13_9BACT